MSVGRSRRPWCYHKRGISLDDNLGANCEFAFVVDEELAMDDSETTGDDSLLNRFGRLLSSEEMADVHFVVGVSSRQLRIPGHRLVLSVGSQVFKNMFFNEKQTTEDVMIPDVDPHAFLEFLRHFYCDEMHVNKDNAIPVLHLAKRFQVLALERRCLDYARQHIDDNNCFALWLSSKRFSEPEIENLALRLVQRSAHSVLLSSDFLRADFESVKEILKNDFLRISEIQLFIAVTRWAKNTCLHRGMCPTRVNVRHVLSDSIDLIRFPLMSEEELRGRVQSEGLLEDDVLRALLASHRTWPRAARSLPFSSTQRTFQRLQSALLTVQRFQSFDNQLANKSFSSCLQFSSSERIFVSSVGVYGPRRACSFYLQISVTIARSDTTEPTIMDRADTSALVKCDASQPIINVKFETPFEVDADVSYDVSAVVSATERPTSQMRAKLNPHLFYSRAQEMHFYYGTGPLLMAKIQTQDKRQVVFTFASVSQSAPPTPAPPPRPPPPKEYRRPSRIERLRRALSFSEKSGGHVSGGQIPVLLFYA